MPPRPQLPGKLESLGDKSQSYEGQSSKALNKDRVVGISPLTPSRGYKVEGTVNGVPIVFLLDTGAAVTLFRKDTWARISANHPQQLEDWSLLKLVGADGSPLTIHGHAHVSVELEGENRQMDAVVVSPLTQKLFLV